LYAILKQSFAELEDQGFFFVEADLSHGALTHLKKIKTGDVVLVRIAEEMMAEYANARVNPHVAIFTSLTLSAQTGTRGFDILKHQTYNNFIVAPDSVIDAIRNKIDFGTKAKMLRTKGGNAALALQAAELFKVPAETAQRVIETFSGLKAHLELVKKIGGVEFYNDSASVTPGATLAALRTFSSDKNTILIFGGAYTGYDYSLLIKDIPQHVKTVILLPGSGTLGFRKEIEELPDVTCFRAPTLEDAVILAHGVAKKGDRVLFSPGCEAVGIHISRKERGEKFVKAVRSL
jgi:UDP-N-acetylmuramoylalanine--D-glutamate ligase